MMKEFALTALAGAVGVGVFLLVAGPIVTKLNSALANTDFIN